MKPLLALLLSVPALAQSPTPEIRGLVAELGTRAPLAGAIATLYEFARHHRSRRSVLLQSRPPRALYGQRYEGRLSREPQFRRATPRHRRPRREVRQPGAPFLRGNIVAATNTEGIFTRQNLTPGPYIVHIDPQFRDDKGVGAGEELADFSEDEFKIIDEDFETSY